MTLPVMAFDPADGYNNKTEFPDPSTEDIGRAKVQDIPDQLRDFLNEDFAPAIDKRTISAKSDNYTIDDSDLNTTITMTGTKTVTLPLITTAGFGAGFRVRVSNVGSGTVTVAATSTDTIAGAASVSLAPGKSIEIVADAAGLWTVHGFDFTDLISTHTADLITDSNGVHGFKTDKGLWTPTISGSTTAGTIAYANQFGKFVKQGDRISLDAYIRISALTVAPTGYVRINGIPQVKYDDGSPCIGSIYYENLNFDSAKQHSVILNPGYNFLIPSEESSSAGVTLLDCSKLASNSVIILHLDYYIA